MLKDAIGRNGIRHISKFGLRKVINSSRMGLIIHRIKLSSNIDFVQLRLCQQTLTFCSTRKMFFIHILNLKCAILFDTKTILLAGEQYLLTGIALHITIGSKVSPYIVRYNFGHSLTNVEKNRFFASRSCF